MKPTSGAFTMPCLSQACLLGYTPSPQQAFQGDATHQAQRHTWLTPNGSPRTWYTRRDYRSRWTLRPFHRTVFTAHTWISLPRREPMRTHHGASPDASPLLPGPDNPELFHAKGQRRAVQTQADRRPLGAREHPLGLLQRCQNERPVTLFERLALPPLRARQGPGPQVVEGDL